MADFPPEPGPPPQYVAYPRGPERYGAADRLQALSDGYFALNWVFALNLALWLGGQLIPYAEVEPATRLTIFAAWLLTLGLVVGFATYPQNKKIGYGRGWAPVWPAVASVLMGLNSALCCGIIGYVVMQQLAALEMKKYGLKTGFGGIRKSQVAAVVAEMQRPPQPAPAPYMPPP